MIRKNRSAVTPFRCLAAMLAEGSTRARSPKPRQGKLRGRGRVRTKDLPFEPVISKQPVDSKSSDGLSTNLKPKSFSCNTLSVSGRHVTRNKHEGSHTSRLPEARQEKSRCRGRVRITYLPFEPVISKQPVDSKSSDGLSTNLKPKSFSCNTLSVSGRHVTRNKHEGSHTSRLPEARQKSRCRGRVRITYLPVMIWSLGTVETADGLPPPTSKLTNTRKRSFQEGEVAQRLECKFTDWKVRGSNPTSASRLPLFRLGQPGSIPALVRPSGGMAARHRKGATAGRGTVTRHHSGSQTLRTDNKNIACSPSLSHLVNGGDQVGRPISQFPVCPFIPSQFVANPRQY
ncbi:hypothetical protein T265_11896 [Opisthorchis viverrini]|uniref:Uncharacterized protein n=1 Tax=Opisthorchis viverrini TaxID=6198 RepID=A0A074Z7S4_OPIVI|nr:hypothetical protein T265_11896 [Opisthorchis viverrini]KER19280.1 hypothetical protein T265_11896 [Opisthorchis viverrini]